MATKEDISNMATKEDISNMATKKDISNMATKEEDVYKRQALWRLYSLISET